VNVAGENVNRGMVISNLQAMGAGDFKYDKIATKGLATLRLLERGDDYPTYCSALNMDFAVQGCKADGGEAPQIGTAQIVTPDNGEMPESGAVQSCKAGGDEIIKSATNEVRAGGEVPQNKKIPSTTGQKVIPIITCGEELFFAHKTVKPTMVEKFYSCPYLNFIDNGLKIRQRELYELKPNIIGSIIHKIIEIYFGAITKNEKVTVEYAIDTVFADERYKRYCDDERNMPLIVALKKEVAFIIDKLQKNLEECSFRPFAVEYEIKKPLDNGYLLHGRIDRVDRFVGPDGRPHYVIIDYKTGAVDSGLPKKIYMGEKLQLPIYASYFANMGDVTGDVTEQKNETLYSGHKIDHKIVTGDVTEQKSESAAIQNGGESYSEITQNIQNSTHEHEIGTICGAGYLPLVKGFASVEKNFQLYGFFDKDWATLFGEKVGINKNGIINTDPRKGQLISGETIRAICKYADKMVDSAVKKIIKGYIAPNPVEKMVCEYCSVRSLCPECENVRRGGVRVGFDSFTGKRNVKEEFIELQIQLVLNEDNNKADSKKYGKDSIKENNNAESKGSIKENNNAEGKDGIKENNKECAVSGKEDKEEYSKAMCGGKCNEKNSEARGEKETRGEK
jgi:RecB family exonuclease